MSRVVYTRWLNPKDATAVARLERRAYAKRYRNGRREIYYDLSDAAEDTMNLSMGLFDGSRLVGFGLAYIRADRASIFEDFEVAHESTATLHGKSIYIEDVVVMPRYIRKSFMLFSKWAREVKRIGPTLPIDFFCNPELLEHWTKHLRAFRLLGMELDSSASVRDLTRDQDWHWLSWRQVGISDKAKSKKREIGKPLKSVSLPEAYQARLIQNETDWEKLREDWDGLVDNMPQASCFQTFDFLHTWWTHFGLWRQLSIVVLYHRSEIVGIAPMMIAPKRILGPYRWRLEFIGDEVNMERPDLIVNEQHPGSRELLWRCVLSTDSKWDAAYFREQAAGAEPHPVKALADAKRFMVAQSDFLESPHVTFKQSWEEYLSTRSKSLRKNLRRRMRQLESAGELRFVNEDSQDKAADCLETYRDLESRSWKGGKKLGVGGNPVRLAFYRELVNRLGPRGKLRFRFLRLDEKTIAATFGIFQNGQFASLEICHEEAFDQYSPGFALTGLELEECFRSSEYDEFDFLIGTYNNKKSWRTAMHRARNVYVLPNKTWGWANRLFVFSFKPRLERLFERLNMTERFERLIGKIQDRFR